MHANGFISPVTAPFFSSWRWIFDVCFANEITFSIENRILRQLVKTCFILRSCDMINILRSAACDLCRKSAAFVGCPRLTLNNVRRYEWLMPTGHCVCFEANGDRGERRGKRFLFILSWNYCFPRSLPFSSIPKDDMNVFRWRFIRDTMFSLTKKPFAHPRNCRHSSHGINGE